MKNILLLIFLSLTIECSAQVRDFEGNLYDTVQIGNQTWLKQNLRSKYYSDGVAVTQPYYIYNNDVKLLNANGYLYSYRAFTRDSTVFPIQGICPYNFHIPSEIEWQILLINAGGVNIGPFTFTKADNLKDSFIWNGNDSTGFSVLPSGVRINSFGFEKFGTDASFWSASGNPNGTMTFRFNDGNATTKSSFYGPTPLDALSCRCVKATKTSINEEKQDSSLRYVNVYPNPASDNINIYTNVTASCSEILIYNSLGKLMYTSAFKNSLIITDYPAGLYILILKTGSEKEYRAVFIKK